MRIGQWNDDGSNAGKSCLLITLVGDSLADLRLFEVYSAEYVPLGGVAMTKNVRLTQYSHGAGCGCKIAPATLQEILSHSTIDFFTPALGRPRKPRRCRGHGSR